MSAPLVPSPLDYIGLRRFAFYPPIRNIGCNEWVLGAGSRSEVQVLDAQSGAEIWVPRQYIGAVSETHEPVLIVGLTKELEFLDGAVQPRVKRVIEMRPALEDAPPQPAEPLRHDGPAPVIGIRVEDREDSPMNRALLTLGIGALAIAALAILLSVFSPQ